MANICTTNYVFEGDGKQINTLYSILKDIADTKPECDDYHDYHCSPNWLGYVAEKALCIDYHNIPCRGDFHLHDTENCPYDDDKLIFKMDVESAWSPCTELIERMAEKYECSLYWIAEELGCELFQSNDSTGRYFHDKYIVDIDDYGTEYFESEEDAVNFVIDKIGKPDVTWNELEAIDGIFTYEVEYV